MIEKTNFCSVRISRTGIKGKRTPVNKVLRINPHKARGEQALRYMAPPYSRKLRKLFRTCRRYRDGLFGLFLFLLLYAVLVGGVLSAKKSAARRVYAVDTAAIAQRDNEATAAKHTAETGETPSAGEPSQAVEPSETAAPNASSEANSAFESGTLGKSDVSAESGEVLEVLEVLKAFETIDTVECPQNVRVYRADLGKAVEYSTEEYLVGVLLAEMPSNFHTEALRAQAIACRTYTVYKMFHAAAHADNAAICTDTAHCQSFVDPQEVSVARLEAARAAIADTSGIVLCYDHEPILAVYHAAGGRRTCSSAEVWGGTLSYLSSVETYESENASLAATRVYELSGEEFLSTLHTLCPTAEQSLAELRDGLRLLRSESGRVYELTIGDQSIASSDFVRAFGLRSRDFALSFGQDSVTVTTYGYGHGVGLSQLGAEDLAQKGCSFAEILLHYYKGVNFGKLSYQ